MGRAALAITPIVCLLAAMPAAASSSVKPGQYQLGQGQHICLKNDGTWYGTTFNMGGRWISSPTLHVRAAIYGNYQVQGHDDPRYGNTSIAIRNLGSHPDAYWSDWFDDLSYGYYYDFGFFSEKSKCDPPFTGENTKAPTQ